MKIDPIKFNTLMAELLDRAEKELNLGKNSDLVYENLYKDLLKRVSAEATVPGFLGSIRASLKAFKVINQTLASQLHLLLCRDSSNTCKVDGYMEYGSPGQLIREIHIQGKISLEGKKIAVIDSPSYVDYIKVGFPLPYDQHFPIKNYTAVP